jgi:hypothetical protein
LCSRPGFSPDLVKTVDLQHLRRPLDALQAGVRPITM